MLCFRSLHCTGDPFKDSSLMLNLSESRIMFDFKPSADDPGDLVESSDDLGANLVGGVDTDDTGSDDDGDSNDEDVADIGDEAGKAEEIEENPFFAGSDSDSDSDVSDVSDDDEDDDEVNAAGGSKEPVDEEDELIKALKAAREKKTRNCPPDIKTQVVLLSLSSSS